MTLFTLRLTTLALLALGGPLLTMPPSVATAGKAAGVSYRTTTIDGLEIAYRDAGPKDAPVVLLLHGFPTSSHMFRNLIPELADKYRVIAPDYPGFGASAMPSVDEFKYSFDSLAGIVTKLIDQLELKSYSLYLMDYGAPVGFRVATARPERIETLIIQNGNAYNEGLREFWNPIKAYWADRNEKTAEALRGLLTLDATKWQYTHGVRDLTAISPDTWMIDQAGLDRKAGKRAKFGRSA